MRILGLAGLASACLATSPVFAADLFGSAPPPMDAPVMSQELGSNWYIRGDVGWGQVTESTVTPSPDMFPVSFPMQTGFIDPLTAIWTPQTTSYNGAPLSNRNGNVPFTRGNFQTTNAPVFSIGAGYRVNDYFRVEATYQIFKGPGLSAHANLQCPGVLSPVNNFPAATAFASGPAVPAGYLYTSSPCDARLNATQFNNAGFANAYVDLGRWWMFMPYVGAGVGLNASTINGSLNYTNTTTGQAYQGPVFGEATGVPKTFVSQTGVNLLNQPIYSPLATSNSAAMQALTLNQNWNRSFSSTKYTIAGQFMAGFGVPISQSAVLDVSYRYTALDLRTTKNAMQSVNLGVRYNIN
jgi:opacity protein-like surface antigen